jgi:hypothetical protein
VYALSDFQVTTTPVTSWKVGVHKKMNSGNNADQEQGLPSTGIHSNNARVIVAAHK